MMKNAQLIASRYAEVQKNICRILEEADGKASFTENKWEKEIGSGLTCVIQNGAVIEKGGVNYSFVQGDFTPQMEKLLGEKAKQYAATGISSIMHPIHPNDPIIHMNVRYFALDNGTEWFGGGIDLTPHFVDLAEAKSFHKELKNICDKYNNTFYPFFKNWADDYFFIPHRNETRGIGGIFFDRLKPDETIGLDQLLDFTVALGSAFPSIYSEILHNKPKQDVTEDEKKWQLLRRGRYVEFNLIYDRGTKFGLESNGNTESILISLPSNASWEYNHVPEANSREDLTMQYLKKGIDWVG
jgi:coproporphyrinogen III oxidase